MDHFDYFDWKNTRDFRKNNLNSIIPDGNNHYRCSLFKFVHPIHGECLISGGIEGIKIRAISKNLNQELDL